MSRDSGPCPFCGSENIGIRVGSGGKRFVGCYNCNAQGPVTDNYNEAVEKWNDRKSGVSMLRLPADNWATLELPKNLYSDILEAVKQIAETNKRILEQEKLIAAKILQEEKEGRD